MEAKVFIFLYSFFCLLSVFVFERENANNCIKNILIPVLCFIY